VGRERGELVGGRGERQAGQLGELRGDGLAESRRRVEAGADGGAADRQRQEARQGRVDPPEGRVELGDFARPKSTNAPTSMPWGRRFLTCSRDAGHSKATPSP